MAGSDRTFLARSLCGAACSTRSASLYRWGLLLSALSWSCKAQTPPSTLTRVDRSKAVHLTRGSDAREPNTDCLAALSVDDAAPLIEAGLCKTDARFLGEPVCNAWHAFQGGGPPHLPVRAFAVGAAFRVEQAKNGAIAWSEHNPLFALYNAGDTEQLARVRLLDVHEGSDAEEAEATHYLTSAFGGRRDAASPVHEYIERHLQSAPLATITRSLHGQFIDDECGSFTYLRQTPERLYLLLSTKHSNAWERESHPVLYFVIMALP